MRKQLRRRGRGKVEFKKMNIKVEKKKDEDRKKDRRKDELSPWKAS